MESNLYKILQENFETLLKYYEIENKNIKKHYNYFIKYKEYTKEYCLKVKELFKGEINDFNYGDYEQIEINLGLNDSNAINNKINKNKRNDINQIFKKDIKIAPIKNRIKEINNFIKDFNNYLEIFIESIQIQISNLNQYIEISEKEINSIKNLNEGQKINFNSKYLEYNSLNKELKKLHKEAEGKLVDFCHEKRGQKTKKESIEKLENNLDKSLSLLSDNENNILEKFNALDNFGKVFNDSTNEKISNIKNLILNLYNNYVDFINNFFSFFQKSFLSPISQIIKGTKNEKEIKNELEEIIVSYIKKINEKDAKLDLNEYTIKVIQNSIVDQDEIFEEMKLLNSIMEKYSFEVIQSENEHIMEDEELYFIAKTMYEKFKLINRNLYILNIEKVKFKLKKTIDKLTSYKENNKKKIVENIWNISDDDNDDENDGKLTKEEIGNFCKYMNEKSYRKYFLLYLNNFRATGALEMPLEIFNYVLQIFLEISKYLYIEKKDDDKEKILIDKYISKLVVILSQTFYYIKDGKKFYIQSGIKDEAVFHKMDFWKIIIKTSIEDELNHYPKNIKAFSNLSELEKKQKQEEREKTISFAQLVANIHTMYGFGLNKEEIKSIILPFSDEYQISQENKEIIFSLIDNQKVI